MKILIRLLINILRLTKSGGYLKETGWMNSIKVRNSVDKNNNPIPWLCYPFLEFFNERLSYEMNMFEYGSGYSTLYWAKKLKTIVSVEHNYNWYKKMKNILPNNVQYYYYPISRGYVDSIKTLNKKFDIIIIDGRERVACVKVATSYLSTSGVIVWDNSLREKYRDGIIYLENLGFKHIDFKGLNPLGTVPTVTSVFYKKNNCLNI